MFILKICKYISLIGIVVSVILNFILFGLLAGESLPYPDPTPELIANQTQAISLYSNLLILGICVTLFFVVVYIIQVVRSRRKWLLCLE